VKYPKTLHHPSSLSVQSDDKLIKSLSRFVGQRVIVTEKMDGENTTIRRSHVHARSLDSRHHPSREMVKALWGRIGYQLDEDLRICGENMFALHSIQYNDLDSYFLAFSAWRDSTCLSWDDSVDIFESLSLTHAPLIYDGVYDPIAIDRAVKEKLGDDWKSHEGWVLRIADSFEYDEFGKCVAKFVRNNHVQTEEHWLLSWTPDKINRLKCDIP
jgi:hypothetical protein